MFMPSDPIQIVNNDDERRELYRALDIKRILADGQAYVEVGRASSSPPPLGDFSNPTQR